MAIPPDRKPFLRQWRKYRGLTLTELAERLGTTQPALSRYETGERQVSVEMLVKLAAELTHAGQVGELFIRPPGSSAFLDALERSAQKAAAARKGPVESLEAMWERSSRERQEQLSRERHDAAAELREDAILQI